VAYAPRRVALDPVLMRAEEPTGISTRNRAGRSPICFCQHCRARHPTIVAVTHDVTSRRALRTSFSVRSAGNCIRSPEAIKAASDAKRHVCHDGAGIDQSPEQNGLNLGLRVGAVGVRETWRWRPVRDLTSFLSCVALANRVWGELPG